jgi:hypothetical protein
MSVQFAAHVRPFLKIGLLTLALAAWPALASPSLAEGRTPDVPAPAPAPEPLAPRDGLRFHCDSAQLDALGAQVDSYLQGLGIAPALYQVHRDAQGLNFTLRTPATDTNTLNLAYRPEYKLGTEPVPLLDVHHHLQTVQTVSRKEIALALMQHGRTTILEGAACRTEALSDHIALRQMIVAWTQHLAWVWPDGGPASWNQRYWLRGTPLDLRRTADALHDAFVSQSKYAIGCYTAAKLVYAHATLDYFERIKADPAMGQEVTQRLLLDNDPLVDIEPGAMWRFEADADPADAAKPGKLLRLIPQVAARNFVPGDWAYIRNTDVATQAKTGYEGSNAVYLGGNRFDDFYDDNHHSYRYEEKLSEVYQWRNGVFSRSRDFRKVQRLTQADHERLGRNPEQGGMVLVFRAVPYFFGFEALPALKR